MIIELNRIHQLETELTTRAQVLADKRRQLASAEALFKRTRNDSDGSHVSRLSGEVRLAELAIDGVREELERAKKPRPIAITATREQLTKDRALLIQQRDTRHRDHAAQVERASQACGYRDPKHIELHVRNIFGNTERMRRQADDFDARRLAQIEAELAEHDRRAGQQSTGPEAA